MANTITAFHTAVAGTKARAAHFNTNFSNFRGDLIPIEPLTATGAHLTYNLGTPEYRWDSIRGRVIDLIGATTTANLQIYRDSAATLGAFNFGIGSTTVGQIRSTGAWFKSNYTISAEFDTGNISATAAAPLTIASSVLSITTYGGNLQLGFVGGTNSSCQISSGVTALAAPFATVSLYLDGNKIASLPWQYPQVLDTTTGQLLQFMMIPVSVFRHEQFGVTAGGHTVYATANMNTSTAWIRFNGVRFFVKEV